MTSTWFIGESLGFRRVDLCSTIVSELADKDFSVFGESVHFFIGTGSRIRFKGDLVVGVIGLGAHSIFDLGKLRLMVVLSRSNIRTDKEEKKIKGKKEIRYPGLFSRYFLTIPV